MRALVLGTLLSILFAGAVMACSLVDVEASSTAAIQESWGYFFVSAIVLTSGFLAGIYNRKVPATALVLVLPMLVHPAWTIPPTYGPDCTFTNVLASQVLLSIISLAIATSVIFLIRGRDSDPV
jgi:hypothetical protein